MGARHNRKLDQETAAAIRREYYEAGGRVTYLQIAQRIGVSEGTVSRIIRGATYREDVVAPLGRAPTPEAIEDLGKRMMRLQEELRGTGPQRVAGLPTPEEFARKHPEPGESPFDQAMRMMKEQAAGDDRDSAPPADIP